MIKFNWGIRACGVFLLWAATAVALPAPAFKTLHSFDGTDGAGPNGLVQATDGNFYGTAQGGGVNDLGTVFKITTRGTLTTLHSFQMSDGYGPFAGLVQGTNGNLYGTTVFGGANGACSGGCGTVFTMTPSGTLTTLYSFCSQANCTDGADPHAVLVQGTRGNLYGTTVEGGTISSACPSGCGTVFKITPTGNLTTLYSFCLQGGNCTDGANPDSGLVQATDGKFYGTAQGGGVNDLGTVFKITPSGKLTTLYSFCSQGGDNCTDGEDPVAALIQSTDGNFYGTTFSGGANCLSEGGCGTVFQITPSGTLTTIYSFCSQGGDSCTDGEYPNGLVQGTDGNFYGTAQIGGANFDSGTVFQITPTGTLTTLFNFCTKKDGCPDGFNPFAGLIQGTDGKFYGTTELGGANGRGTVFRLSVGLTPFVETQPTSGTVGKAVKILGTNLTGATSVTFNGTAAAFTMISKSLIRTTVPTGATTGTVQVVTPGGTLSSNVPFTVTP
jgi:uncharacterized repeat protein (TIGR03803 family)